MPAFDLTAEIGARLTNIKQVAAQLKKELAITAPISLKVDAAATRNAKGITSILSSLNKELAGISKNSANANAALKALGATFSNLSSVANKTNDVQKNMDKVSKSTQVAADNMKEFGRVSGLALRRNSGFILATTAVFGLGKAIQSSLSDAIKFERELVKIAQVTGTSTSSLGFLKKTITELSTSFGVSSLELAEVAQTLAQAGLSAADTEKSLGALAKTKLAATFGDIQDTTEGAIALMAQFGIKAGDLEKALGSVNSVAAKFAVESDDIVAAIKRSGGVFAATSKGVSEGADALNEFIAVFTSVRATTRESAETIATGLRTIFTRIQRPQTIEFLKQLGINLTDLEGKFVGPFEAINRLSGGLAKLDTRNPLFAQVIEELGGFRQVGKVIPLLSATETRLKALAVAQSSTNSLNKDAAQAQEALAVQIAKTQENFAALLREISQTSTFKSLVGTILGVTNALISFAESIKPVIPLIATLGIIKGVSGIASFTKGFIPGTLGRAKKFHKGGLIPGKGTKDEVPAVLQSGEFVMRRSAVEAIGKDTLDLINSGVGNIASFIRGNNGSTGITSFSAGKHVGRGYAIGGKFEDNQNISVGTPANPLISGLFVEPLSGKGDSVSNDTLSSAKWKALLAQAGIVSPNFKGKIKIPVAQNFLDPQSVKKFTNITENNITESIRNVGARVFGLSPNDDLFAKVIDDVLQDIQINDIKGKIFEGAIASTAGISRRGTNRRLDFLTGDIEKINSTFGKYFGPITSPYADAKYTNTVKVTGELRDKLLRQLVSEPSEKEKYRNRIVGFAGGGKVNAMLTKGEYVINRDAAQKFGYGNLEKLNSLPGYAVGGRYPTYFKKPKRKIDETTYGLLPLPEDEEEIRRIKESLVNTARSELQDEQNRIAAENERILAERMAQERQAFYEGQSSRQFTGIVPQTGPGFIRKQVGSVISGGLGFAKGSRIIGRRFANTSFGRFSTSGATKIGGFINSPAGIALQLGGQVLAQQIGGTTGAGISGGLAGASSGAALGSFLGPVGAGLGAIAGAALGAYKAFQQAKLDEQLDALSKAINKSSESLSAGIEKFRRTGNASGVLGTGKNDITLALAKIKLEKGKQLTLDERRILEGKDAITNQTFFSRDRDRADTGDKFSASLAQRGQAVSEIFFNKLKKGQRANLDKTDTIALATTFANTDLEKKALGGLAERGASTDDIFKIAQSILFLDKDFKAMSDSAKKAGQAERDLANAANTSAEQMNLLSSRLDNLTAFIERASTAGEASDRSNAGLLSRIAGGAGIISQTKTNIFKNPKAFTQDEFGLAALQVNNALGNNDNSKEFASFLVGAKVISDRLPAVLNNANTALKNGSNLSQEEILNRSVNAEFSGVPEALRKSVLVSLKSELSGRQKDADSLGKFLSGENLTSFTKDLSEKYNNIASRIVEVTNDNISKYENALNSWVGLQRDANDAFDSFVQTSVSNTNTLKQVRGQVLSVNDKTLGSRLQASSLASRAGITGRFNAATVLSQESALNAIDRSSFTGSPDAILRQQVALNQKQQSAVELLRHIATDTTKQVALQDELNSLVDNRRTVRNALETAAFGTPTEKFELNRSIVDAQSLLNGGIVPSSRRAAARQAIPLLGAAAGSFEGDAGVRRIDKQFERRIGENINAQATFGLLQNAANVRDIDRTTLPKFFRNNDPAFSRLFGQLKEAQQNQEIAARGLAGIQQRNANTFLNNAQNSFNAVQNSLADGTLLDRLNRTLEQLPEQIKIGGRIDVTLNIPGAEVLGALSPQIQELVSEHLKKELDKRVNPFTGETNGR